MKITGSLLITTLFFAALSVHISSQLLPPGSTSAPSLSPGGNVSSLRPGGRNVLTRNVSYTTTISTSISVATTNGQTCTTTWGGCWNCRRCRTVYRTVWRTVTRLITRIRPIYYCAPGWRQSGNECTIPICTGGCDNNGTCISPEQCQCSLGWEGLNCKTDTNECATNNGGCQHHCANSPFPYECSCDPGYDLVGLNHCRDIDECRGNNSCEQICINTPGNYSCDCYIGYRLDNNSKTCSDIDECLQPKCQYKCNNTAGSFFCTCPEGYLLTSNRRDCADHDECMTGNHTCEQRCINHPGGYTCACHTGFNLNKDNQSCSDVDECKSGVAGCAHQCNNTIGSFQCICRAGYFLNSDNRTCTDHDECTNGQHTCSQSCGNTPGSYYCTCLPGYYLDSDFRTCKGYPCSSITKPAKGYMNCTGYTMDSVCHFGCQPGYELVGSVLRMCLASGQWSGDRAVCRVKHCNRPTPPANGFVHIPCSTTYKGKCSFGCNPGFFLNGSKTVTCSADSRWVPISGQCEAITVCHPNPCYHGGACHPLNSTAFWCNCTRTAHTGSKCHVGIVRTPNYPRLQQNSSVNVTFELSPPKHELKITPSAEGLEFFPRELVVTPEKMEQGRLYLANMTITAGRLGIHQITYTLSGLAAKSYQAVLPDTLIVVDNSTSCHETSNIRFPEGCHKVKLLKCPKSVDFLCAGSTEPWKDSQGRLSTKGVASILSGNLTLPLGIKGATLDKMNHSSVSADKGDCQIRPPKHVQCLVSETLASVFLQSLNESFPNWLRLIPLKSLSSFGPNDVITYIWTGKELKGILKGLGLSVKDESYYSVLLYSGEITVEVNESSLNLPKYGKNAFLLVAVELCSRSLPANVLLAFNPLSYDALVNMPVYRQLATQGWNVNALAMQFSRHTGLGYSAKTWNQSKTFIPGNLEFYGRVEKTIRGSHPVRSLAVRLVGNAILDIPYTKQAWIASRDPWVAGFRGQVNITITVFLLKQQMVVTIPFDKCSGQIHYRDSKNNKSCKTKDTYSLFLNGPLRKDPFASTLLGSFIESANSNVALFADAHSVNNYSLSELSSAIHLRFQLNGTVKFGPLKFPNMFINIEVYSKAFKCCSGDMKFPGLKMSATFNQKATLGRLFTTSDSDTIQIFLPPDSQETAHGILNTTVALLGNSFQAQVVISNNTISFRQEINLLNSYRLSINASSRLQTWEFLLLQVNGMFPRTSKLNSDHGSLEDKMKEIINDYIKIVAENTVHRLKALQNTDDKIKARISRSKLRLSQAENNTHLAVKRYLWALKAQKAALKEVKIAEKNVSNSTEEVNQLKASLERLCSVNECPYVCVTGTACNTCYKDLISKEQGLCPGTCHNVLKERLPPFKEIASCLEEKCEHSGGDILSFVGCNFEKVGKSLVTTGAKAVITYGLVSVGVPPNVAYPIASGTVTYASTGSPEEAAVSAGIASAVGPADSLGSAATGGVVEGLYVASQECGEGGWDCKVERHPCEKSVFNYKFTNVPYRCDISCQVNVIKETVAAPCCKNVNCASRIKNLTCTEKNAFCRIAREKAMFKFTAAKRRLIAPFVNLQKAKKNLRVVESELAKLTIELEAASSERNILRRAHDALAKAANISRRANDQNRALLEDALALVQLWNSNNQTCPVDIKEISFAATLSSPSEAKVPVLFKAASKNREKTIFPIVNFASLNKSLQQTAKKIVKELFGNVNSVFRSGHPLNQLPSAQGKRRRKRAIDEGDSDVTVMLEFKKKCALATNYHCALSDIIGSLYNISAGSLLILSNVTDQTLKHQHAKSHDFAVNLTQAVELGLTDRDVNDSMEAVFADEEVVGAASLLRLRNATNQNKVQTAIEMVHRDWEASMENVFNLTSMECNGFADCLEDFVDNLYYLYQEIELPESVSLQQKLTIISTEVKSLISVDDLSVTEVAEKSFQILQILRNITDEKIFCAVPPNITNHPVAMKDMKKGQTLELSCKATGDPAPSYRWRKNGALLPESEAENLRIENLTKDDSGNYICEAYNHVSVVSSTPTYVLVHSPPTLVYQPPKQLNIPINTGFHFRCNATSVARPLQYQWLFMPLSGDGYSLVPNGNFSVLKLVAFQKHEEGFYKCNVSNPFDFTLSHVVQVRVLGFSLVVHSLEVSFEIAGDNKSLQEGRKMDDNSGVPLHKKEQFQKDVGLSLIEVINNLVNLSSNAVQNLTVKNCEKSDKNNDFTCAVSLRLRSFNVTTPESMNRPEYENALSVLQSFNKLKRSVAVLVNESFTKGIRFYVRNVSINVDNSSWNVGGYRSLCPTGTMLFRNNFLCINCPPGSRGDLNGTLAACFLCPAGTYQPYEGQTSCIPCPLGSKSGRTGLEKVSSCKGETSSAGICKDLSPHLSTSSTFTSWTSGHSTNFPTASRSSDGIARSSEPPTVSTTANKERTPAKPSDEPGAFAYGRDGKEAAKWKIAFGVCVTVVAILLAGIVFYAINYRIKRIRHLKVAENGSEKRDSVSDTAFPNPIYEMKKFGAREPVHNYENAAYQMDVPPEKDSCM